MATIAELMVKIGADTDGLEKGMGNASKIAGNAAKTIGAGILVATAAVGALVKASLDGYAEYEQLTGGVETLFKDSGDTVMEYANNAFKTAGLSANEYMTTVTSFSASLLQSLGGDTAKAATAADVAITDMADNANKMGSSMESVQYAYQGFAKQNYTMLDNLKLGYGGTKEEMQRLLEDAEKLSGVKYDMSSLNDVYSAIHVVQTEMGITGTTAKEASETIAGSVSAMKSAWSNLVVGIADDNADFDSLISNLVDSVETAGENIIPRVEQILVGVGKLISELAPIIAEKIPGVLEAILPSLLEAGGNVITSLLSGIVASLPTIIPAAVEVVMQLVDALIENLPLLVEAAMQIIISLAMGIADALPELIPSIVDTVLMIVDTLIENIDMLTDASIAIMIALAEGLITALPKIIEKVPEIVVKLVSAIIQNAPKMLEAAVQLMVALSNGLANGFGEILNKMGSWISNSIIAPIKSLPAQAIQWGKDMLDGFISGITSKISTLVASVKNVASTIASYLHFSVPDVGPLTDYESWMPDFMQGLASGVDANNYRVANAMNDVATLMQNAIPTNTANFGMTTSTATASTTPIGMSGSSGGIYITITGNTISDKYDIATIGEDLVAYLSRKGVRSFA